MIKETKIRFSGVTSREVYKIISEAAKDNCITVSRYISTLLENEALRISDESDKIKLNYAYKNDSQR